MSTATLTIYAQLDDGFPYPIAQVEITAPDGDAATRVTASALRSVANILDSNATFDELVEELS